MQSRTILGLLGASLAAALVGCGGDDELTSKFPGVKSGTLEQSWTIEGARDPMKCQQYRADRMRIVYANEGACRALGYAREELIGAPAAIVFADIDEAGLVAEYRRLVESGEATGIDRRSFRRKDGGTFPVEVSRQLLRKLRRGHWWCRKSSTCTA